MVSTLPISTARSGRQEENSLDVVDGLDIDRSDLEAAIREVRKDGGEKSIDGE